MTSPNIDIELDLSGMPVTVGHRVDTASAQYSNNNLGEYKKLPEGVAIITLTNRSQGGVRVVFYDGANFDNETDPLAAGETRVIQRVVTPNAWGIRLDIVAGHPKKGWVGWQAVVTPTDVG